MVPGRLDQKNPEQAPAGSRREVVLWAVPEFHASQLAVRLDQANAWWKME